MLTTLKSLTPNPVNFSSTRHTTQQKLSEYEPLSSEASETKVSLMKAD
jgi:hypothetical protein